MTTKLTYEEAMAAVVAAAANAKAADSRYRRALATAERIAVANGYDSVDVLADEQALQGVHGRTTRKGRPAGALGKAKRAAQA